MEKHPFFLSFGSSALEKEFRLFYEQESRIFLRIGIGLSLFAWAAMALMSSVLFPQKMGLLLPVILGCTFLPFSFILYTTYKERFLGHYQWMATAANSVAGFVILFSIHHIGGPYAEHSALIGLMIILFFGFYIFRLRFIYASIATFGYMSAYQVYLFVFGDVVRSQFILLTFAAWITVFLALFAGYLSESINRELFIQRKTIAEQQEQMITKEKMAAVGSVVAGVAHEINNPIGAINSMAHTSGLCLEKIQAILDSSDSAASLKKEPGLVKAMAILGDQIKATSGAGMRIAEIIRSLRNFIRLDEAEFQLADINEGIDSTMTLLRAEAGDRISIIKDYGDIPPIGCYAAQLNQVFIILLRNAVQAIDGEGEVRIRTALQESRIHIQISDSGRGISEEQLKKIFDISFSQDSGQRVKMATGLSLANAIVKKHDGEIRIESRVGQGSTFTVILPVELKQ